MWVCVCACAYVPWDSIPRCAGMRLLWPGSQSHVNFGKSQHLPSPDLLLGGGEGWAENLLAQYDQD